MHNPKGKGDVLPGLDARTLCLEVMTKIANIRH
jgi:hypothetical protein